MTTLLVGCGSTSSDFVQTGPSTGGTFRDGAFQVVIPPGGVSQAVPVTLSVLQQPPMQPADADFHSVGQYLVVDVGAADLTENFQVTVPYKTTDIDSTYLQIQVGNLMVPLETQVDTAGGMLTATIPDPQELEASFPGFDASHVVVGPADSSDFDERPAHVPWPAWNAYLFENGSFRKIVNQGLVPLASPPALGSRPVVVVHGFGSDASRFPKLAQRLVDSGYTSVLSFEYDTLSSLETTGSFLQQFYQAFPQPRHLVAHSMGCLVTRQAFETSSSREGATTVVLVAGPNQGTPVVNKLQSKSSFFDTGMNYLLSNNLLDFKNADGTPCQPLITDPGFVQLAEGSQFLGALNALPRPEGASYRTLAGTRQGQFAMANFLLGVKPEDGLIPLSSANSATIGAVRSDTAALDHVTLIDDATGLDKVVELLK